MNRTVSTILIPLLLVSQSLCSAPHSHAASSIAEPDGHAARPHVHLHDADHHHGHHEDGNEMPSSTAEQVPGHDSDAIYAGDVQLLHDGKVVKVAKAELTALSGICDDSAMTIALSRFCTQPLSPQVQCPKCALYLQLLSVRC